MMPILYRADETEFDTYGIGVLSECTFCEVTEERNGAFECVMKYPLQGALLDEIKNDRFILVSRMTHQGHSRFAYTELQHR